MIRNELAMRLDSEIGVAIFLSEDKKFGLLIIDRTENEVVWTGSSFKLGETSEKSMRMVRVLLSVYGIEPKCIKYGLAPYMEHELSGEYRIETMIKAMAQKAFESKVTFSKICDGIPKMHSWELDTVCFKEVH